MAFHSRDHRRCSQYGADGPEDVSGRLCTGRRQACWTLCVPGESVSAPASGVVPHSAAAGCIDVDANDKGVVGFVAVANGYTVDALTACCR